MAEKFVLVFGIAITLIFAYIIFFTNGFQTHAAKTDAELIHKSTGEVYPVVEEPVRFDIDGYSIILSPELPQGSVGRTYSKLDRIMYIEDQQSLKEVKTICEHELLHLQGMHLEDHGPGDKIYELSRKKNSEICIRFLYELHRIEG